MHLNKLIFLNTIIFILLSALALFTTTVLPDSFIAISSTHLAQAKGIYQAGKKSSLTIFHIGDPIDNALSDFLIADIEKLFGSTTTLVISTSHYITNQKNAKNTLEQAKSTDRTFSPENFDRFELTLDWARATGTGSHVE